MCRAVTSGQSSAGGSLADVKLHKSKLQQEKEAWAEAVSCLRCLGIRVRQALPCLILTLILRWDLAQAAAASQICTRLPR